MTVDRWVPVVPVRMTEAWLLVDERAIRVAAANPSGRVALELPPLSRLETLSSPKEVLRRALETASERTGRRLQQFRRDMGQHVQRVAQLMQQKEKLRELHAFKRLEKDTREALRRWAETCGTCL
jgi:thiamine pyrophosphate-dependent acetolactate synthase large subunit-like protein